MICSNGVYELLLSTVPCFYSLSVIMNQRGKKQEGTHVHWHCERSKLQIISRLTHDFKKRCIYTHMFRCKSGITEIYISTFFSTLFQTVSDCCQVLFGYSVFILNSIHDIQVPQFILKKPQIWDALKPPIIKCPKIPVFNRQSVQ